ncbi:ABC transporter permease [Cutibacterium equinum]|uniref:ABC transporter permease n=1 Tax=Cutibacterium equinum TaxID=3016342 RepID=A0ABY7QWQ8_9ACTN|nr:ABC transporter permease [Cutibacterium equinum]WCC79494.1 ABC transporter permease [Cutibacterium equinum]
MVAHVLKYQWATTLAPFRKGAKASERVGLIGILLMALFLGGTYFAYVLSSGQLSVDLRGATVTTAGASLIVFWIALPVLFSAQPIYTDPSRYAIFPRRARELMPAFVTTSLLGLGGVIALLVAASHVLVWNSVGTIAVAVVGVLLGWAGAVIASNLVLAAISAVMAKRRFREAMTVLVVLVFFGVGIRMQFGVTADATTNAVPVSAGKIIGWTPLGWAWSMPWEAARGLWLLVIVKLVLALAGLVLMVWAWQAIVDHRLVSPTGDGGGAEKVKAESRIDRMFPATPTGAIAGRTLRYMKRDPRMMSLLLNTFLIPILGMIPTFINGGDEIRNPHAVLVFTAAPFMAMLCAIPLYAGSLISYDGTALWHHIEASVTGAQDRRGRAVAYLVVTMPIGVLLAVAMVWRVGRWELLPVVVAEACGALMLSIGIGSWIGVVSPMRVPESRKGGGFNSGSGSSAGAGCLGGFIGMVAGLITAIPIIALVVVVGVTHAAQWSIWLTFVAGLGWSFLMLHVGIIVGGRRLDRSWDEVLKRITPIA